MAVETRVLTDAERRQLKMFFEQTRSVPQLLATLRSRRVGMGYAIESGDWDAFDFADAHDAASLFARGLQAVAHRNLDEARRAATELNPSTRKRRVR